jgi:RHS repeat-associated protein
MSATTTTSVLSDALGSTMALTDGGQSKVTHYSYGAYGAVASTGASGPATTTSPFEYTGADFNPADQLVYLRNRFYSPQLGRFVSEDPIGLGRGANVYAYVRGNPISYVDPWGLWASVTVSGNSVTIVLPIQYSGPGATPGLVQDWNNAIEKAWSGQFGRYQVRTTVTNGPQNQITVPCSEGRSITDKPFHSSGTWYAGGFQGEDPLSQATHESGLLMGMDDKYFGGTPYPNWEHDIMGAYPQPVTEKSITQAISNSGMFK